MKVEIYNRYYNANIPIDYWDLNLAKTIEDSKAIFKGPEKLLDFYFSLANDLDNWYITGKSYFLLGNHGIGKTYVSTNLIKKCCLKNKTALYSNLSDIVSVLTGSSNEEKFISRKELLEVDYLVLDECDPRFIGSDNAADLFGRTFENIIRTRISNKLPTILISNSPNPKEMFVGSLKASIDSLLSKIESIAVIGPDVRKS